MNVNYLGTTEAQGIGCSPNLSDSEIASAEVAKSTVNLAIILLNKCHLDFMILYSHLRKPTLISILPN